MGGQTNKQKQMRDTVDDINPALPYKDPINSGDDGIFLTMCKAGVIPSTVRALLTWLVCQS